MPDINKCSELLEPFAVLWETIGQYLEANNRWYKTPLLKLNPVRWLVLLTSLPPRLPPLLGHSS